jgi:hypothetical protein
MVGTKGRQRMGTLLRPVLLWAPPVLSAALILYVVIPRGTPTDSIVMAEVVPKPSNLDDVLRGAELVVVGEVVSFLEQRDEPISTYEPAPGLPPVAKAAIAYYHVRVDEVVAVRGGEHAPTELVLRVHGYAREEFGPGHLTRMPKLGDKRLFVLRRESGGTWGAGPYQIFHVDGPTVRHVDAERTVPTLAGVDLSPPRFKAALRDAIAPN